MARGNPKLVRLPRAYELVALADTAMEAKHSLRAILDLATKLYQIETNDTRQKMLGMIRNHCEVALAGFVEPKP